MLSSIKNDIDLLNQELENALDECNPDEMIELSNRLKNKTDEVKNEVTSHLTEAITDISIVDNKIDILKTSESTLHDLKDLIILTKGISNHLYGQLVSIDVLDPLLVSAAAEFIKSTRESISDFIQLYRDERNFLHRTQLAILQFNQRKELLEYKYELEKRKDGKDITDETVIYTQEAVMNALEKNKV